MSIHFVLEKMVSKFRHDSWYCKLTKNSAIILIIQFKNVFVHHIKIYIQLLMSAFKWLDIINPTPHNSIAPNKSAQTKKNTEKNPNNKPNKKKHPKSHERTQNKPTINYNLPCAATGTLNPFINEASLSWCSRTAWMGLNSSTKLLHTQT